MWKSTPTSFHLSAIQLCTVTGCHRFFITLMCAVQSLIIYLISSSSLHLSLSLYLSISLSLSPSFSRFFIDLLIFLCFCPAFLLGWCVSISLLRLWHVSLRGIVCCHILHRPVLSGHKFHRFSSPQTPTSIRRLLIECSGHLISSPSITFPAKTLLHLIKFFSLSLLFSSLLSLPHFPAISSDLVKISTPFQ